MYGERVIQIKGYSLRRNEQFNYPDLGYSLEE
jgi:hypothetical protein